MTKKSTGYLRRNTKNSTICVSYRVHTQNKKTCQPWATSAPASAAIQWQSAADSGMTLPLTTSWPALWWLGFCIFARGGEFYCFLYQCPLKRFFSDTGDVCRSLCRQPSLLFGHSEATHVLYTPYAVRHTCDLQKFVLKGCFGCGNTTHRRKSEVRKFAMPATAFAGVHGSFWPIPVCRACLPHCRRHLARTVFLNLRRGVSSIVFLIDEF